MIAMSVAMAARQVPSPGDAVAWGSQAERLGIVGIIVVVFVLYVTATLRQWLVMGWAYRLEREEKIMWRTAYMELRGTTREVAAVARIATEKAIQP